MRIRIITVGKKNEAFLTSAIDQYTERVNHYTSLRWDTVQMSGLEGLAAREEESNDILHRLEPNELVWLLDERGEELTSQTLAEKFENLQVGSTRDLTIIIGGSYGVSDAMMQRANFIWSLSKLVFPHQLVRLILAEQLYRAFSINAGSKYHHA